MYRSRKFEQCAMIKLDPGLPGLPGDAGEAGPPGKVDRFKLKSLNLYWLVLLSRYPC